MSLTLATSHEQWWKPGARRFHQRQHVMIAAVNAMHEGDEVGGAVGQAQAERALVEFDRGADVGGEDQHMRQAARAHGGALSRVVAAATPGPTVSHSLADFWSGDTLRATLTSISTPSWLRNQKPLLSKPGGGSTSLTPAPSMRALAGAAGPRRSSRTTDGAAPWLCALDHRTPAVLMAEGLDRQRLAVALHVEAEAAVEILGDAGVRHREHELVERMHAERVAFRGRRDIAANGGHLGTPERDCCGVAGI